MRRSNTITKQFLQEGLGIVSVWERGGVWCLSRNYETGNGSVQSSIITQRSNNGSPSFALSVDGKTLSLSAARVVWTWFFRDIRADETLVFLDGDRRNLALRNMVVVKKADADAGNVDVAGFVESLSKLDHQPRKKGD